MKIAAANAIAELARQQVPEEVAAAYGGRASSFGPEYIIPSPFDPRLMEIVPAAVAKAASESGVAQRPVTDMAAYRTSLRARLTPTTRSGAPRGGKECRRPFRSRWTPSH